MDPELPATPVRSAIWKHVEIDRLPALLERLARMTGLGRPLPSNGGDEAVETRLKAARTWGYRIKNIPAERAEIVV